jgi:pSer/pThr/pTyr-binding forkhead associated (FHA) protein
MTRTRSEIIDPSQPSLIVQHGNTPRKWRQLKNDVVLIGRARNCDVELASDQIAPVHCVLARIGGMWLLRDCGSPVGTHVNGELVQAVILHHGDEVQLGTFSFTTHFPENAAAAEAPPSEPPAEKHSSDRSRRNLVNLALKMRRRLHDAQSRIAEAQAAPAPAQAPAEMVQQTEAIEAKTREYELRVCRLEEAERELATDRDTLNEAYSCLAAKVQRSERDLARRKEETELEIKKAWDQLKERCHGLLRDAASPSNPNTPEEPRPETAEEIERLKLRTKELDAFAAHLRQERLRIRDREMELAVERVRLVQLAQAQSQDREHPRKDEIASLRKPVFLARPTTSPTTASS